MTLIWASSFISCGLGLQTSSTGGKTWHVQIHSLQCTTTYLFSGQQCRSGAFANEFICDGANITEWQFDNFSTKAIEKITINKTFLSEFPAYAFNGLEIAVLLIEDNPLLKSIDPYAFKGLHFCETVIIRSNENLDIPLLFNLFDRLPGLKYLYLDDNFIQAKNADNDFLPTTAKSNMPDLQVLSLKGNPLQKISVDFFKPLATSSLKEINLQDCKLESIEIGAMQQVGNLKHVDLSTNYKLIQNQMHATLSWTTLKWTHLSLADNYIFELPYGLLEDMNETLQELDFSRNLLIEMNYFPMLTKLKTLYLDDCSIQTIAQDTFKHLIGLERLSIKRNRFVTLPGALILPSLKSLFLSGDDDNEILDSIDVVNETFGPMTSLEHLQMTKFNFNRGLTKQMFQGLSNLTSLDLSYSSFSKINPGFLEHLPALQNLTMSNCKGFTAFPSHALRGPRNLQFVDLSSTLIFPIISGDHLSLNSSSLSHIKELNLSSSLVNVNDALSNLDLAQMPELAKLDLSSNKIHNWSSKDKFGNNSKLEVLIMKSIHDYISLTKTMIDDFSKLKYLDLTENLFICNEEVADFFLLAEKSKTLFVEGWYHGFGFRCIQDPELGNITTFYEYASNGLNMSDPIPQQNIEDSYSKMTLILVVIGVSSIVIITILINVVHQNWWMIQYKVISSIQSSLHF